MSNLSSVQLIQELQYQYPYHYIPDIVDGNFRQSNYWSWGMHYLGGLELILSQLSKLTFNSLIDVGCGDGRFLREVHNRFNHVKLLGVDYSYSAIQLAKAFNPSIIYNCLDITRDSLQESYDIATLIEVLEHIPPSEVPLFLESVRKLISPSGFLIVTVPHINKPLNPKHYQHFSANSLCSTLSGSFSVEFIMPFERLSRFNNYLMRLLGYKPKSNYLITNSFLNNFLYHRILSGCLNKQSQKNSGRLLALAKPILNP